MKTFVVTFFDAIDVVCKCALCAIGYNGDKINRRNYQYGNSF